MRCWSVDPIGAVQPVGGVCLAQDLGLVSAGVTHGVRELSGTVEMEAAWLLLRLLSDGGAARVRDGGQFS